MRQTINVFVILLISSLFQTASAGNDEASLGTDTSDYPYWIDMLEQPDINFFDIQRAFNTYWHGRQITRGCGWKQFRRWESYMWSRMRPDGTLPETHELLEQYRKYYAEKGNDKSKGGNWTELGPIALPQNGTGQPNGNGRVNALAFHPQGMNIIFAGTSSGGLWITADHGATWSSNTDNLPSLGVSAIAFSYYNPQVIYIGTGDRDHQHASGVGVMKSTNGGSSWASSNTGMGNKKVGDLLIHPSYDSVLIAATNGGIYRSTNSGASWVLTTNYSNFKDLEFHPSNPNIVYSTASGDFYRSVNNGQSWTKIVSGLPSASRSVIGVTPDAPNLVYFLMTNTVFTGFYKSSDAGLNFSFRSNSPNIMDYSYNGSGTSGQSNYNLAIAVDPQDSNIVYAGGINVFKSYDGGINWIINSHWVGTNAPAVHADCHDLKYNTVNGRLYAANDGGVYYTTDGGSTWIDITSGMGIGQIYKIGQSATAINKVISGFQDNGTATYLGASWLTVYGGDGMECAFDYDDTSYSYTTLYYGPIFRLFNNSSQGKIAGNGTNGIDESGAWITPFILHNGTSSSMFVGYKNIWRSTNVKNSSTSGVNWQKITGMGGSNFKTLEHSPANNDILYASKYYKSFYRSDNVNGPSPTFTTLTSYLPGSGMVVDIEAHPTNAQLVYIIQNRRVYRSADKGVSWTDITGTLPDVPFNTLAYYNNSTEGLYLGTDIGVFYRDIHTLDWVSFSNGLPATGSVTELEIFYHPVSNIADKIRASTFGRGLWESGLYQTVPDAGFIASDTMIPVNCPISFTDKSAGVPNMWFWTFEGGSPASSFLQHPTAINYSVPGQYYVKLVVSNATGTDTIVKQSYISVSDTLLPSVQFVSDKHLVCFSSNNVLFTDETPLCPKTWLWEFTPSSVNFLNGTGQNSQNPVVEFVVSGYYDVSLTVSNSNGSSTLIKDDYILAGGFAPTFTEDFEDNGFEHRYWTIENPDGNNTWEIVSVGGSQPGDKAARVKIFDTNTLGQVDRLISAPLTFENMTDVYLSFQHAYAQYETAYSDSLRVYISDDCGLSWQNLLSLGDDGSGNFATHPPLTSSFLPSIQDDWCGGPACNSLDLSAWAGMNDIRIMFETYSYISNNIYVDNIEISASLRIPEIETGMGFQIFPNPSSGEVFIYHEDYNGMMEVSVYNLLGSEILNRTTIFKAGSEYKLDLASVPEGLYLLRINNHPEAVKLLIRR